MTTATRNGQRQGARGYHSAPTARATLTTGQVAELCGVAPRTISKWFDAGQLRGFRIPGGHDRRIYRDDLLRFLNEHGMTREAARVRGESFQHALAVGLDQGEAARLAAALPEDWRLVEAVHAFAAGVACERIKPAAVVLGTVGRAAAREIATALADTTPRPRVFVLVPEDYRDADTYLTDCPDGLAVAVDSGADVGAQLE